MYISIHISFDINIHWEYFEDESVSSRRNTVGGSSSSDTFGCGV